LVSTAEQPLAVPSSGSTRARRIWTNVILVITTILAVLAIVAIWANRQLLNADNWAQTSTSLLQNPTIRAATANYLVDQLYNNVDVAGELSSALPSRLQPLADPLAGALRNAAVSGTELALSRPLVQNAWRAANKAADQALINVVNGGTRHVSVNGQEVTLNLRAIVDDVAAQLGISADLGAKLPPSVANLVILKSNQIKLVQDIGQALSGLALVLNILVPLLYLLALFVARGRRRRTLLWIGVSGIVAGLIVILFRSLIVTQVAKSLVSDDSIRPAAQNVISIATTMLTEVAGAVMLVGAVVVVCAWFAGPSRFTTPVRRWIAPFLRKEPVAVFAIIAAILLIIFIWQPIPATGKPLGMIIFAILAVVGTEALRRQTDAEFPSGQVATVAAAPGPPPDDPDPTLKQKQPTTP
jgi:hypothetical protein